MVISEPALPLVVVWLSLACIADCCNRTPAKSSPIPTTAAAPVPLSATTAPATHKLKCEWHEKQRTACLNNGTCFVVILEGSREAFCNCPVEWRGNRCQEAELPFIEASTQLHTANIAAGVAVAVFIAVVLIAIVSVYMRWRKKQTNLENAAFEDQAKNEIRGSENPGVDSSGVAGQVNCEADVSIHHHTHNQHNNAQSDNRNGPQKYSEETTV